MTHPASHAAPAGIDLDSRILTQAAFEEIAASWDGCEGGGIHDIGASLLADFNRLARNAANDAPAADGDALYRAWHKVGADDGLDDFATPSAPVAAHADDYEKRIETLAANWKERALKAEAALANAQQDAARYRVLREHVSPSTVRITMRSIPPQGQSPEERIDMLCDQLIHKYPSAAPGKAAAAIAGGLERILDKMEVIAQVVESERLPNTASALRGLIAQAHQATSAADAKDADPWHDAADLPPDHAPVLAELKPRRKNMKPIFAVVSYFRTQKGVHDAEPGWFEQFTDDTADVVRWQPIRAAIAASQKGQK